MISMAFSSETTETLLLCFVLLICIKKYKSISTRTCWTKEYLKARSRYGAYSTIFQHFKEQDPQEFYNFVGMSVADFDHLLKLVTPYLLKRSRREPLQPELKLAAVLNWMVNGSKPRSSAWLFLIGRSTMYKILPEVSKAIVKCLQKDYIKFPQNETEWLEIADGFLKEFDMPHCVGAVDSKQCKIDAPALSGVSFKSGHKKINSIGLLATCDAYRRFTWVSIGSCGSEHDSPLFLRSNLNIAIEQKDVKLPKPRVLPNSDINCPFFFVGDGNFPHLTYLLKPFRRNQTFCIEDKIFSIRLTHARKIIECAFGVLTKKWNIFQRALNFKLENTEIVILAAVCLHNYIITRNLDLTESGPNFYRNNQTLNRFHDETDNSSTCSNSSSSDSETDSDGDVDDQNKNKEAKKITNVLKNYFISAAGYTRWQWKKLSK